MKKIAIALTALPLTFMGIGFAAASFLVETPANAASAALPDEGHGAAEESGAASHGGGHGAAPDDGHGDSHETVSHPQASNANDGSQAVSDRDLAEDRTLVRLGQMTVPVEKSKSVSYIVVDLAVKTRDMELAQKYTRVEYASRLRDEFLNAMLGAAETPLLRGASIDSDALASRVRDDLAARFDGIEEVLFVSLYKQDVPRI